MGDVCTARVRVDWRGEREREVAESRAGQGVIGGRSE